MLEIYENVKGKRYGQLIDILSRECNRFAFVENRQLMEIEEERLAYVYYFQLNNATRQFLKEHSHSIFDWIGGLPEDLMFYQNDKCMLAVCSHERYFWVEETIWDKFRFSK